MKLVMTLLVRDEDDILAANLDFHLSRGVDFFVVTDNLSVDGTRDILARYEALGVLKYLYQAEDDYSQHRWVTHMARMAASEFGADWVINNDADEFWWPEQGDLKEVLSEVPPHLDAVRAARTNFVSRSMESGDFFADAMTLRETRSTNDLGKPLPSKAAHRGFADIEVQQGNHRVFRMGEKIKPGPVPISILHFPRRSYRRFANKIAKGGAAYERNTELVPGAGGAWRHLHGLWKEGRLEANYRQYVVDDRRAAEGLAEGRYVLDERLKAALAALAALAS